MYMLMYLAECCLRCLVGATAHIGMMMAYSHWREARADLGQTGQACLA